MMRSPTISLWLFSPLLTAGALPGCSSPAARPDAATGNPTTLWLAPNGDERHAKLAETEPPPW